MGFLKVARLTDERLLACIVVSAFIELVPFAIAM
jgi:hypothetical protein